MYVVAKNNQQCRVRETGDIVNALIVYMNPLTSTCHPSQELLTSRPTLRKDLGMTPNKGLKVEDS